MWIKVAVAILLVLVGVVAAAGAFGAARWRSRTVERRATLQAGRLAIQPAIYDARELAGLPAPVQRYLRAVLTDGQAIVATAHLSHAGEFNMGTAKDKWNRFTSSQMVVTRRAGFDWEARIRIAPGLKVFVHDSYVAGEGVLHAAVLGLVTVADTRGTAEVAEGELLRFLAEGAWYPTVLLPSQGVRWEAMDENSARGTLTDGTTTASLEFHFDAQGLIHRVRAPRRYRLVDGKPVATPWQCRFGAYEVQHGMRIPLDGEVEWDLPEGPWPYWRGRITEIVYEFAG